MCVTEGHAKSQQSNEQSTKRWVRKWHGSKETGEKRTIQVTDKTCKQGCRVKRVMASTVLKENMAVRVKRRPHSGHSLRSVEREKPQ